MNRMKITLEGNGVDMKMYKVSGEHMSKNHLLTLISKRNGLDMKMYKVSGEHLSKNHLLTLISERSASYLSSDIRYTIGSNEQRRSVPPNL